MSSYINYTQLVPFVSEAKFQSIKKVFGANLSDLECYKINLWSQKAAASIYPLLQQVEVTLRNSIDIEVRKRMGDKWWDRIYTDTTKKNHEFFIKNIRKAESNYRKEFSDKYPSVNRKNILVSHDDIIARTDFSTWQYVLSDTFMSQKGINKNIALWPRLTFKVLRGIDKSCPEKNERLSVADDIYDIRNYRNRLSHNDCIWVKVHSNNAQSAIETIRLKIKKIQSVIYSINPNVCYALDKLGCFRHALRVCSLRELEITLGKHLKDFNSQEVNSVLSKLYEFTDNGAHTAAIKNGVINMAIHEL